MATVTGKERKTKRKRRKPKVVKKSIEIDDDFQRRSSWEQQKERQLLFNKLESEKDLLEKERTKVKSERMEIEKKRKSYLKEKTLNDRRTIKYSVEKELWLERNKRKGHKFNKLFLMDKVAGKIKMWETKAEEAKQEWINIATDKVEMKELEASLRRDQEQLKIDQEELSKRKMEFEVKYNDLSEAGNENKKEKARLKILEDSLLKEERKHDKRIQKYKAYDLLVTGRESGADQIEEEQIRERLRVESVKQNLLAILNMRKADFNDQSIKLYEDITRMDGSFAKLFQDMGEKVD